MAGRISTGGKKAAYALGLAAEEIAARHLAEKGCRVLGQRVRTAAGELDLVVEDRGVLVFVEVKARAARAKVGPLEAVDARKRARLAAAAAAYLAERGGPPPACRFDVVALEKGRQKNPAPKGQEQMPLLTVLHLPDAFRPGD